MNLEVEGKVIKILSPTTGSGNNGPWTKQDFVIETMDTYPRKICFTVWNDKTKLLDGLQLNESVKVGFEVSSREYQDKWFSDIRAWRVEKIQSGAITSRQPSSFQAPQPPSIPLPGLNDIPQQTTRSAADLSEGNDLPF